MNEQTVYAIKKAAVLAALAALGVVAQSLATIPLDPTVTIVATAVVAALLRILEGIRDGHRAAKGDVIAADVAYAPLAKVADTGAPLTVTPAGGSDLHVAVPRTPRDR